MRDAVFLHGYNEPVLVLLHEAEPTWAGNLRQKVRAVGLAAGQGVRVGCSKTCGRHGSPVMVQLLGHALRAPPILYAQPHRRLLPSLAAVRRRTRVC